ncbi:MAG: penicillin acylase family protein, partial [Propionibacteriales bacterium]|nr:penicillin acylase family protein [Propionibacteriales bacterium]
AFSSLAVVTVRESFPQTNGQVVVPALNSKATVLRDSYGVPNIYADTPEDLFAAQGYVAAQDRFFEMDFRRRVTAGRLSELFGPDQFETDVYVRTLGWRQSAEQEARALTGSTKRYMEAYAAGVNAWMDTRSGGELSLEYAVLGLTGKRYQPDPWTVADSLAWFKAMAWDLSGNRLQETELATLGATVGDQRAAELWPAYDLENYRPIIGRGAVVKGAFDPKTPGAVPAEVPKIKGKPALSDEETQRVRAVLGSVARLDTSLPKLLGDLGSGGLGSNSWVISGDRTTTGSPLLSNDPHLAASMPATFGQVGLHCNARDQSCPFDMTGFAFSGVPGVIIGNNTDIAWGLTNPYVDTQDLYVERVRGDEVQYGKTFEPVAKRVEQVSVAGEPVPREITVRSTRHGPLLSDVDGQLGRGITDQVAPDGTSLGVALQWTATKPGTTVESLFGMNAAKNFKEFRAAAKAWGSPSQNLTYADRFGNIGYQLPGDIPIRGKGDGLALNPGWDPAYDWKGLIPFEELPWDENPPSGYIITANQPIIGRQYGRQLNAEASYGWRSQRIETLINSVDKVSPADAESWFADDTMPVAADVVPALLRVRVNDGWVAEGQRVLVGWDYRMGVDSAAAAYFAVVYKQILIKTFNDELPED